MPDPARLLTLPTNLALLLLCQALLGVCPTDHPSPR